MDDLISRQAAIDEIKEIYEWHDNVTKERIIEHFERLPSAERKKGEWIIEDTLNMKVSCGSCGFVLEDWIQGALYRYCPNCGADMRERKEK